MSEDQIKGYVEAAEKDLAEKKDRVVEKAVKEIVQETLERIEDLDKKIDNLQEEKKILKQTIDDLKSGNLKLLKERLEKDKAAADLLTFRIIEGDRSGEHLDYLRPLFYPYIIRYNNYQSIPCTGDQVRYNTYGTYCLSSKTITLR